MDKTLYAIITPDPYECAGSHIIAVEHLGEIFEDVEVSERQNFRVRVVSRTERWFNQFPEL